METLILSDLHLGSPLFIDVIKVIDLLSSRRFEEIILLGDIFDTWENNLHSIIRKNKTIVDAIWSASIKKKVIYIVGNHDPKIGEIRHYFPLIGIYEQYPFHNGIIVHGHQFDDTILKHSLVAKFLFKFQWICERLFNFNIRAHFRELFHSISMKKQKKYYNSLILDIEKEAVKKYSNYKYVVMGHTHFPKIVTGINNTKYINAGDWIHNRSYVTYESETDDFQLII